MQMQTHMQTSSTNYSQQQTNQSSNTNNATTSNPRHPSSGSNINMNPDINASTTNKALVVANNMSWLRILLLKTTNKLNFTHQQTQTQTSSPTNNKYGYRSTSIAANYAIIEPNKTLPSQARQTQVNHKELLGESIESKRERKAAKVTLVITGVFVVCWLPFFVVALAMPLMHLSLPSYLLAILLWLGYVNSLLNPIIYTIFSPDFRLAFKKMLCVAQRSTINSNVIIVPSTSDEEASINYYRRPGQFIYRSHKHVWLPTCCYYCLGTGQQVDNAGEVSSSQVGGPSSGKPADILTTTTTTPTPTPTPTPTNGKNLDTASYVTNSLQPTTQTSITQLTARQVTIKNTAKVINDF